jgi:hypothetical protein
MKYTARYERGEELVMTGRKKHAAPLKTGSLKLHKAG